MLSAGWWAVLDGDETDLGVLAMHFNERELHVVKHEDCFHLGSIDFADISSARDVCAHGDELLAIASGSIEIEIGGLRPPRVVAAMRVDESGTVQRFTHVSATARIWYESNQIIERTRDDGSIEVVEIAPALPRPKQWVMLARADEDVADALAVLGRGDARWQELYFVYEIVEQAAAGKMLEDGWTTKALLKQFTQTANSRRAIGRDARHAKDRVPPPTNPMELTEARGFVRTLVRRWLESQVPAEPRVVRVLEVRPSSSPTS